jgi:AmiR/NasT family two-component response regulator
MSRDSAAAWRQAGLTCIPLVEQAKGIVMARQRCGPVEAFDLLHRASQRANIQVHVLAEQVVEHLASSREGGNVTPISLGAIRYPR